MPELPDVESFRRYMQQTSMRKNITDVSVEKPRLLKQTSAKALQRGLQGSRFSETDRCGKYLFARHDDSSWLVLHFGMTGTLEYFKEADDVPDYTALLLRFDDGFHLAYTCRRMLGQIRMVDRPEQLIEEKKLGPDAYADDFDFEAFDSRLKRSRGSIKPAMMNQSIMSGLGNVYVDEILFQAGIDPRRKIGKLAEKERRAIHKTMRRVLRVTIDKKAQPDRFPKGYLTRYRDEGADCPRCDGTIERVTVSGRAGYMCDKHQK